MTNHRLAQSELVPGNPLRWIRDFLLIGTITGALAPYFVIQSLAFSVGAGLMGGLCGAALGGLLVMTFERVRGRLSLWVIGMVMPLLGALWGGSSGIAGGVCLVVIGGSGWGDHAVILGFWLGSVAGTLQLTLLWLPYTMLSTMRRRAWLWGLVCVAWAPALGWIALLVTPTSMLVAPMGMVGAAAGLGFTRLLASRAGAGPVLLGTTDRR